METYLCNFTKVHFGNETSVLDLKLYAIAQDIVEE